MRQFAAMRVGEAGQGRSSSCQMRIGKGARQSEAAVRRSKHGAISWRGSYNRLPIIIQINH